MTSIVADDCATEAALHKLVGLLRTAGAQFADGLVIKGLGGNLSIEAPTVRRGMRLVRLPQHCLVPLSALRLTLVNDDIVIASARSGLHKPAVAISEAMLEIYNLCGKLAQHRRTTPWSLIAAYPDLLSYVAPPSRDDFPFSANDIRSGNEAKVMLASFLHSRLFTYDPSDTAKPRPVILPVTDFFNHDWRGEPYAFDAKGAVVMRRAATTPGKGNETFARYGLHDAYDMWITYGFIDDEVPFVQSLETAVKLRGVGTIRFGDVAASRGDDDAEPTVQDLPSYVPRILDRKGGRATVGAAVIPGPEMPRALRRALGILIGELGAPRRGRRALVLAAEEQLLDANLGYYSELKSCLEGLSVDDAAHAAIHANFIRLCDQQTKRLRAYLDFASW